MPRKKRAGEIGIRDKKNDLTPPNAIRRAEIVEEIVDHLRPWKDRKGIAAVAAEVSCELHVLLKLAPLTAELSDSTQNCTHARRLDKALADVEALLAAAPGMLATFLFNPLPPLTVRKKEDGGLTEAMPLPIEDIERAYRKRADYFAAELKRLRQVCVGAIDPGLGSHPNYDHAKHISAYFARGLLSELSKNEITGTEDGPFRTITSLLYEAASGRRDADLKRACDDVLRGRLGGTNPPI